MISVKEANNEQAVDIVLHKHIFLTGVYSLYF